MININIKRKNTINSTTYIVIYSFALFCYEVLGLLNYNFFYLFLFLFWVAFKQFLQVIFFNKLSFSA